ncbi:MAG: tRNA-dihydrouridine synthase, partial [Maricaulaceae bacterium]
LGVDDQDVENTLPNFIETVAKAGCTHFIVHARKAWLKGLSPKENRDVPPLDYELVRKVKVQFPQLEIALNGGLADIDVAIEETKTLDGFMLGRAAYHNPWILTQIDSAVYGEPCAEINRDDIAQDLIGYACEHEKVDRTTKAIIRHIMGLYAGQPGARQWRRNLSEGLAEGYAPSEIISYAAQEMAKVKYVA